MIYFTAHTFKCVCHCRRAMFRVLGMYNFACGINITAHAQTSHNITGKNFLHGCEISVICVRDHQPKSYTITDFP